MSSPFYGEGRSSSPEGKPRAWHANDSSNGAWLAAQNGDSEATS